MAHLDGYLDELKELTLAVYERYAVEVVERFGFCPWARSARESGDVTLHVVFSTDLDDFSESLAALTALHQAPEQSDIALFIYPLLDLDRLGFEDYVRRFRGRAEAPPFELDAYAMAAFHPAASVDLAHPDRLVPFVRRSPDPTLQLVRNSALSSIKGLTHGTAFLDVSQLSLEGLQALSEPAAKPLRERIAEQNLETVKATGPAAIEAVLNDIARAREAGHDQLFERYGQRGPRHGTARRDPRDVG
ncbi:MAG TPA: DUF1415 family protein [Polyangiaceae bacterium]|nr:DUF1415 family protein [Polyangiaceae bacterium]